MTISRHSWEWKRTMFEATAAGVTFQQVHRQLYTRKHRVDHYWIARHDGLAVAGNSKYAAACSILSMLMGGDGALPDAAKSRREPQPSQTVSGNPSLARLSDEKRTEEF